jgi:hypothetical protein
MLRDGTVYDFVVVLRDTHGRAVRRAGALLSLLGTAVLAYRWQAYPEAGAGIVFLTGCALLTMRNLVRMRRHQPVRHWPALALAGAGLLLVPPFHPAGLAFLALARLEAFALRRTEVGFSAEGIRFNGPGGRRHAWTELRNVVLRDGLLTIDLHDNRLFQRYADDQADDDYEAGEDEFNRYCRERLAARPTPPQP